MNIPVVCILYLHDVEVARIRYDDMPIEYCGCPVVIVAGNVFEPDELTNMGVMPEDRLLVATWPDDGKEYEYGTINCDAMTAMYGRGG